MPPLQTVSVLPTTRNFALDNVLVVQTAIVQPGQQLTGFYIAQLPAGVNLTVFFGQGTVGKPMFDGQIQTFEGDDCRVGIMDRGLFFMTNTPLVGGVLIVEFYFAPGGSSVDTGK